MLTPRRFLPSISSLRALEALDRLGSASAVAQELSLTQSAVSWQLQALEKQMGTEMVQRDQKRLTLTAAAKDYAAEIRQALTQITSASMRLQVQPTGGPVGSANCKKQGGYERVQGYESFPLILTRNARAC